MQNDNKQKVIWGLLQLLIWGLNRKYSVGRLLNKFIKLPPGVRFMSQLPQINSIGHNQNHFLMFLYWLIHQYIQLPYVNNIFNTKI